MVDEPWHCFSAKIPNSPYYAWFWKSEEEASKLVERSTATPADVAAVVHQALTSDNPKLCDTWSGVKQKLRWLCEGICPAICSRRSYFDLVMRRATQGGQWLDSLKS